MFGDHFVHDGIRYLNIDQIETIEVSRDEFGEGDRVVTMASGRYYHSTGTMDELAEEIEKQQHKTAAVLRHPSMIKARSREHGDKDL